MKWTPELVKLFQSLKDSLISSLVLAHYDSSLPTFLKKDWSAIGMGFIIMQPAIDATSLQALNILRSTWENKFDCRLNGPRLRPILFGSRKSTETESHYHSFVGEVETGQWAISENRVYFWMTPFYWLCDTKIIYKILNYDKPVYTLRWWVQELLAYMFICVHRPNNMMQDVDALSRYHNHLVVAHVLCANTYHHQDMADRFDAYISSIFDSLL